MMLQLSSGTTKLLVNNLGFIQRWSTTGLEIEFSTYFVFLKDYSRSNPHCRQWDSDSEIQLLNKSCDSIEFIKPIEDITSKCRISALENGWKWTIQLQGPIPRHHRFGVAISCGEIKGFSDVYNKLIRANVSQYTWSPTEVFPDQTFLNLPIIVKNGTKMSIFSSYDQKSQFFTYKESLQEYVRLTASTTETKELEIFCIFSPEVFEKFISCYPNAQSQIESQSKIKKIADRQGISILLQDKSHTFKHGNITINVQTAREHEALKIITELSKYPKMFLSKLKLNGILLCGQIECSYELKSSTLRCDGLILGLAPYNHSKWILWNISPKTRWAIHHEIYHLLEEDNIKISEGKDWGGSIFSLPNHDCHEHCADLFALLMTKGHCHEKNSLTLLLESRLKNYYPELFSLKVPRKEQLSFIQKERISQFEFGTFPPENFSSGDVVVTDEIYNVWH